MFRHEQITSFSTISLRISGMRSTEIYEILSRGGEAEISHYLLRYRNGEDERELQKRVAVPAADMIEVLNLCGVIKWDGFSGKNPPGLLDGTMFSFRAAVNDDRKICARGSNNFPRHYRDFTDALHRVLYGQ